MSDVMKYTVDEGRDTPEAQQAKLLEPLSIIILTARLNTQLILESAKLMSSKSTEYTCSIKLTLISEQGIN
jgi:hypothetical protein